MWSSVRIVLLFTLALVVVGPLPMVEAQEDGCFLGNSLMTCPLEECIALETAVKAQNSCSTPESALSKCTKLTGCFNLRQARARWLQCYAARVIIMQRCFGGGNYSHQKKAAEAIEKVFECDVAIRLEGCGDRC